MTGVLSDDGKWMWDGSTWHPVPSEGIPKPPSEPPSSSNLPGVSSPDAEPSNTESNWRPEGFVENLDTENRPFNELSFRERAWAMRFKIRRFVVGFLVLAVGGRAVVEFIFDLMYPE